jgi:hypothetical protein
MSIAAELTRISGAKSDILTALENKGVTVPEGTKLGGVPDLIDSIAIGETEPPNDGKTRLYIYLYKAMSVTLYFTQTAGNGMRIDWGDGSQAETTAETGNVTFTHAYGTGGNHTVTLEMLIADSVTLGQNLIDETGNGVAPSVVGPPMTNTQILHRAIIGSAFHNPGFSTFLYCIGLFSVTLAAGITYLDDYTFIMCSALETITIPASVTALGKQTFLGCALKEIHFLGLTPPTVETGNDPFSDTYPNLTIYVPAAAVSAYQAADGWSTYAAQIVGE